MPKEAAGLAADWELERRTTASEAAGSGSKATPLLELWFPWFPSDLTISAAAAAAASSSLSWYRPSSGTSALAARLCRKLTTVIELNTVLAEQQQ